MTEQFLAERLERINLGRKSQSQNELCKGVFWPLRAVGQKSITE